MQTTSNSSLPFEHLYSHFLNLSDQHTLTHTPTESAETTSVFSQEENINNLNNSSFVHIKGKTTIKHDEKTDSSSIFSQEERSNHPQTSFFSNEEEEVGRTKLLDIKSKRITKREAAKNRVQKQKRIEAHLKDDEMGKDKKSKDDEERDKKKIQQKIRNRISAQQSRDRKKAYIETLEAENQKLFMENQMLRQEIMNLRIENENNKNFKKDPMLDFGDDMVNDEADYEENSGFRIGNRKMYSTLGLAMIGLVTFCMIINFGTIDQHQINLNKLTAIYNQSKELVAVAETPTYLPLNWKGEFQLSLLKNIKQMRNDILYKIRSIDDKFAKRSESGEEIELNKKNKFLGPKSNSLVVYSGSKDQSGEYLSTMFCPSPYIYQDNSTILSDKNYKSPEWIHLLIPKRNMPKFFIKEDQILITNVDKDNILTDEGKLVEMWCKVYGMRDTVDSSSSLL